MKILYICTHNRCRSILSESITNQLAQGRLHAYSAGSHPADKVHPLSIQYLKERGFSTKGLKSQSWNEFEDEVLDLVVTVCDSAANETCPTWFGNTAVMHWALPDPSKAEGNEQQIRQAFMSVIDTIESRVKKLIALDFIQIEKRQRKNRLSDIITHEGLGGY